MQIFLQVVVQSTYQNIYGIDIFNIIIWLNSQVLSTCATRNHDNILLYMVKNECFQNSLSIHCYWPE